MSLDLEYYEKCFATKGHHYKPKHVAWSNASDAEHVLAVFKHHQGEKVADVLVKLVFDIDTLKNKNSVLLANNKSYRDALKFKNNQKELVVNQLDIQPEYQPDSLPLLDLSTLTLDEAPANYDKKSNQFR